MLYIVYDIYTYSTWAQFFSRFILIYMHLSTVNILFPVSCSTQFSLFPPDDSVCRDAFQPGIKGTMSSQARARVDERHFEIVGPTFSNTVKEAVLICLNRIHLQKFS